MQQARRLCDDPESARIVAALRKNEAEIAALIAKVKAALINVHH